MTQKFYEIEWDIRPLEGVGPLEFGMSKEVIYEHLGKPESEREIDSSIFLLKDQEYFKYNSEAVFYNEKKMHFIKMHFKKNKFNGLDFSYEFQNLRLNEVNLLAGDRKNVLHQLYELDDEAYADLGAVYFRNLGIGISEPGTEPQNDSCAVMNKESIEFIIKDMPRYQP